MHAMDHETPPPNPAFPVVIGLLMPWVLFLAAFTPRAHWPVAAGLLSVLGLLLLLSAAWSYREARRLELDAARWAVLTVLTLGAAMLMLSGRAARSSGKLQFLCDSCGRLGDLHEPFCYGCGTRA